MDGKRKKRRNRVLVCLLGLLLFAGILSGGKDVYADEETGIYLKEASVTMSPATTRKLKLMGAGAGVTWKSSDKKIAAVDSNGMVTAKTKGNVSITASYQDIEYVCAVRVAYETATAADGMSYKDAKGEFGCMGRWFKKKIGGGKYYFTNTDGSIVYFKTVGSKYVNVNFA